MIKKSKYRAPAEMALNISSLMDILTILLLFLIVNFGTQDEEVKPPENFELPDSVSDLPVKLAVHVSVSEDSVLVDRDVVATAILARHMSYTMEI